MTPVAHGLPGDGAQTGDPTDPLIAASECDDAVLAIITGLSGPSYRPLGEIMAFCGDRSVGSLSSGCIEADLAGHAQRALTDGAMTVRYGEGSPWFDLRLPCGGAMQVTLIPRPRRELLQDVIAAHAARERVALCIGPDHQLNRCVFGPTGDFEAGFRIALLPAPRFLIFGEGVEASVFAGLVHAAGYPHLLLSADPDTLARTEAGGCHTRALHWPALPTDLEIDDRTAVILFFHDHDWEPPILARALESPAFYVGAQGSLRTRNSRLAKLRDMGITDGLDRLRGPIGLIPSVKDPRILAVSVLAEVLACVA